MVGGGGRSRLQVKKLTTQGGGSTRIDLVDRWKGKIAVMVEEVKEYSER